MKRNVTRASTHAWFNGAITPREAAAPSVASISFHLGTGVFDGLMAYWNRDHYYLHRAEAHLQRLITGAARMGLNIPWSVPELMAGIRALLETQPPGTQYVRPIAYRQAPELWVTGNADLPVDLCIFTVRVDRDCDDPLVCHISPVERISARSIPAQTKVSGAYVNSFHARRTAELAGFQDGIMLDREGRITEASAANFFAIADGRLVTPPLNLEVFPGITREVVIELADHEGIPVDVSDLRPSQIAGLDGAFLCSTLMEIRPISRLGETSLSTSKQAIYRRVLEAFRVLTHN